MLQQLLWAEVLLKGSLGLVLAFAPGRIAVILGLPVTGNGFWPRLTGALLLGLTAALLLQGTLPIPKMITPAGLLVINLSSAAMLVTLLVLGKAATTRRGNALLWAATVGLTLLSLVEIAFA
jgi:hypothetical protein